jgi:hypothetical protein
MKISAEVREFARLQDAGLINSTPVRPELSLTDGSQTPVRPELVEELPFSSSEQSKDSASASSARTELGEEEAEKGMAEMSERYREGGNHLYIGANGREHD